MKNAKNIRQRRGNTDLKKKREKKRQAEARENCENRVRVGKAFGRLGGHEFLQLIGNSRICRVKYLLNSWRRNWTWNRIRNFNSNFQTTRSRSLSLCKIETREVLFFLFFSFFVDLKREHISLATNFKWNKNHPFSTRSSYSAVKNGYLLRGILRRRRYKKKRRGGRGRLKILIYSHRTRL